MWCLISAKVTPLKSCTFTKRFLLSLFSAIPVIIESPTITQVPAGHVCLISLGEASFIVQFSLETSLLLAFWKRSNCWRFCCLYSVICLILVDLVGMLAQSSLSSLREKCPNREFFLDLRSKSPYSVRIQENADHKKLRTWTLFNNALTICCVKNSLQ